MSAPCTPAFGKGVRKTLNEHSTELRLVLFLAFFALWASPLPAHAEDRRCDGPSECCPVYLAEHVEKKVTVEIGIVVMGLANLMERAGSWDADYYLYERWPATVGFTPQTEVVNESTRQATQFDTTDLRDGICQRSRRIHSTLRCAYNIRTFPFDRQVLPLEISDDQFTSRDAVYADRPRPMGFDDGVLQMVSGWQVEGGPHFAHQARAFQWEAGTPAYDYGTFTVPVRRHATFHVTKYFLPLFVIVAIAFSVFWVDADDLSSQATIGVTCVLAAIAFQLAEATNLPEVAYLTLADRVYVVCYLAIGLALMETIYSTSLARRGKKDLAVRIDRRCRTAFPLALLLALVLSVARAFAA
jgi:hypothetical protein